MYYGSTSIFFLFILVHEYEFFCVDISFFKMNPIAYDVVEFRMNDYKDKYVDPFINALVSNKFHSSGYRM